MTTISPTPSRPLTPTPPHHKCHAPLSRPPLSRKHYLPISPRRSLHRLHPLLQSMRASDDRPVPPARSLPHPPKIRRQDLLHLHSVYTHSQARVARAQNMGRAGATTGRRPSRRGKGTERAEDSAVCG